MDIITYSGHYPCQLNLSKSLIGVYMEVFMYTIWTHTDKFNDWGDDGQASELWDTKKITSD